MKIMDKNKYSINKFKNGLLNGVQYSSSNVCIRDRLSRATYRNSSPEFQNTKTTNNIWNMYRFLNMLRICPFSTMFLVVWYIINEHVVDLCWNINCNWNVTLSSLLMQPIQRHHLSECVRHLVQMVLRLRHLPSNVMHFSSR